MTVRLHTMPCYPHQGGYYYRNNATAEYGDHDNEIVGTRATDENGYLSMDVYRPCQSVLVMNNLLLLLLHLTELFYVPISIGLW